MFKKGSALVPTWTAFAVTRLLESEQFKWLVEYEFTAEMEVKLDDIAVGDGNRNDYLSTFWDALQKALESGGDNIDPRHVCTIPIGEVASDTAKKLGVEVETPVVVRVGKYGPFSKPEIEPPISQTSSRLTNSASTRPLSCFRVRRRWAKTPIRAWTCTWLTVASAGTCSSARTTRRRSRSVRVSREELKPDQVDFEVGHALLALPREVGPHPESGDPIMADYGRYGAFIKCGSETRSIRDKNPLKVLEVTIDECMTLLAKPKRAVVELRRS